jgi:small subunit ribosomal protein S20
MMRREIVLIIWRIVVANIKSQIKRNRQNDKKRLRNRVFRGEARIAVRAARTNIDEGTPESKAALMQAISNLDRAAVHGVIHKNNAARRKSRLMKAFAKMAPVPVAASPAEGESLVESEPAPKKKASSRRTTRKVEEPKTVAAAETMDESKASSKAKKAATASPKTKKADAKKSAPKTTAKKKTAATKES